MYAIMSALVYSIVHMKFIKPLAIDAPLDRFSEARAVEHVRVLVQDGRQVSPRFVYQLLHWILSFFFFFYFFLFVFLYF